MKTKLHRVLLIIFLIFLGYLTINSLNETSFFLEEYKQTFDTYGFQDGLWSQKIFYAIYANSFYIVIGVVSISLVNLAFALGRINAEDEHQVWELYLAVIAVNFPVLLMQNLLSNLDLLVLLNLCLLPFYYSYKIKPR